MFVNSDIKLFKYYFSVTKKEQSRRFVSSEHDPLKQWKLSPVDKAAVSMWSEYTRAKEAMFFYTDTAACPWTIIKSDDKKRARLNCMQDFLSRLDYPDKNLDVVSSQYLKYYLDLLELLPGFVLLLRMQKSTPFPGCWKLHLVILEMAYILRLLQDH